METADSREGIIDLNKEIPILKLGPDDFANMEIQPPHNPRDNSLNSKERHLYSFLASLVT